MVTTTRIYKDENLWIGSCMRTLGIKTRPEFFKELHRQVILGKQKQFYNSLPQVGDIKPLKGKRIHKTSTAYR